jgi:hypothetical protein
MENQKTFYIQENVGKAKYVVNLHDGVKKHKDNSNFFDVVIFGSKQKCNDYCKNLIKQGYIKTN